MKKIEHSPMDPFVKWFFPKLLPFVPLKVSANMVSALGITLSFLAGLALALSALFSPETAPFIYTLGGFLIFLTWITDTMDGVIARSRKQVSLVGHFLDHFGDSLSVVFIGVGMFASNGSHVTIGLITAMIYLLFHVSAHIKVKMFDSLTLPAFGPTEIRFLIVTVIFGQALFDFGQPLSWFPAMTGVNGWLTKLLGFSSGLTFIDLCGIIVIIGGVVGITVEFVSTLRKAAAIDKA